MNAVVVLAESNGCGRPGATERAVDRVLASPLAEHAVGRAVSGPLVDAAARDIAGHAVVERVAEQLLRAGAGGRAVTDAVAEGPRGDCLPPTPPA